MISYGRLRYLLLARPRVTSGRTILLVRFITMVKSKLAISLF